MNDKNRGTQKRVQDYLDEFISDPTLDDARYRTEASTAQGKHIGHLAWSGVKGVIDPLPQVTGQTGDSKQPVVSEGLNRIMNG